MSPANPHRGPAGGPLISLLIVPRPPSEAGANGPAGLEQAVALAEAAEAAGLHACYFPEHHGRDDGYPTAPLTLAGYLGGRLRRIRVGTGVSLLPLQSPLAFAEQLATLDGLLGDRLHRVGVGMGGLAPDYAAAGVPFAEMVPRFSAGLRAVRALWRGDTVTADVGSTRIADATLYPRPPAGRRLPVAVGAMSPAGVRRAGRLGLPWITDPSHSLESLEALHRVYRAAAGEHAAVVLMRNAWPAAPDEAAARWWPHVERSLVAFSVGAGRLRNEPGVQVSWPAFRDRVLVGEPAALLAAARTAAARLGADEVVLRLGFPTGPDHHALLAAIDRLGAALDRGRAATTARGKEHP